MERRYLTLDWRKRLQLIQQKVSELALSLPADATIPQDQTRDYWAVLALRNRLAESATRSLLGGLTGPAADWDKLVRAYETKNVFLGEATNALVRKVDYEIPYFKKQSQKAQQQLADLERRQLECSKSASSSAATFQQECQSLGIKGKNISTELQQLPQRLPQLLLDAVQQQIRVAALSQAVQYYSDFVSYTRVSASQDSNRAGRQEVLPTLSSLASAPDRDLLTARKQALHADEPCSTLQVIQPHASAEEPDASALGEIDWVIADQSDEAPTDQQKQSSDGADIDWNVEVSSEQAASVEPGAQDTGEGGEIDWDIDIAVEDAGDSTQSAAEHPLHRPDQGDDESAMAAGPVHQGLIIRYMDDNDFRNSLHNDLHELVAFLTQRHAEASASEFVAWAAAVPESLQQIDAGKIAAMLTAIQNALAALSTDSAKQLLLIRNSAPYRERMIKSLERTAGQENKFKRLASDVQKKHQESQRALVEDSGKLAGLQKEVLFLKKHIEGSVSKILNGRTVNVYGANV